MYTADQYLSALKIAKRTLATKEWCRRRFGMTSDGWELMSGDRFQRLEVSAADVSGVCLYGALSIGAREAGIAPGDADQFRGEVQEKIGTHSICNYNNEAESRGQVLAALDKAMGFTEH